MRLLRRHPSIIAIILASAMSVAGCGSDGSTVPPAATASASSEPSTTTQSVEDPGSESEQADGQDGVPTPAQLALGRRLDALSASYSPVSARVNYLVAAETLRADAIASSVADDILRERAGSVRLEILRMRPLLVTARRALASQATVTPIERRIRSILIEAVDTRIRALVLLDRVLETYRDPAAGDSLRRFSTQVWSRGWGESIAHARSATTAIQDVRTNAGIPPAPEEAIR